MRRLENHEEDAQFVGTLQHKAVTAAVRVSAKVSYQVMKSKFLWHWEITEAMATTDVQLLLLIH